MGAGASRPSSGPSSSWSPPDRMTARNQDSAVCGLGDREGAVLKIAPHSGEHAIHRGAADEDARVSASLIMVPRGAATGCVPS